MCKLIKNKWESNKSAIWLKTHLTLLPVTTVWRQCSSNSVHIGCPHLFRIHTPPYSGSTPQSESRSMSTVRLNTGKMAMAARRLGKVSLKNTALLLCDMQEKFRGNIMYYPQIIEVARRMLEGANALDMPVIVTEQYPKGRQPKVIYCAESRGVWKNNLLRTIGFTKCTLFNMCQFYIHFIIVIKFITTTTGACVEKINK